MQIKIDRKLLEEGRARFQEIFESEDIHEHDDFANYNRVVQERSLLWKQHELLKRIFDHACKQEIALETVWTEWAAMDRTYGQRLSNFRTVLAKIKQSDEDFRSQIGQQAGTPKKDTPYCQRCGDGTKRMKGNFCHVCTPIPRTGLSPFHQSNSPEKVVAKYNAHLEELASMRPPTDTSEFHETDRPNASCQNPEK